jgi:hypothetical protein
VLLALGVGGGALTAGIQIAITSIQHRHVSNQDSLEAMNIWSLVIMLITSALSLFHGHFLQNVVMRLPQTPLLNGALHFDWIKGFGIFVAVPVQLVAFWQLLKLPNTRPYYSLGHFFSTISGGLLRSSLASRLVYHEDEGRRAEVARWFGDNVNPLNIDPLLKLLGDPSYDVKVTTVRSLARTRSPLAGEKLLEILKDEGQQFLSDHVAWALGELRHAPARDTLIACLGEQHPTRLRAMAARALGKFNDPAAIEPLAAVLRSAPGSQHLVSSVCRSLIRLNAIDCLGQIYDSMVRLSDREERFELAEGLCAILDVPNRWVLVSEYEGLHDSLLAQVDSHSEGWRREHAEVIEALRMKDFEAVKRAFRRESSDPRYADSRRVHALRAALEKTDRWLALTVIATAWLLLRRR